MALLTLNDAIVSVPGAGAVSVQPAAGEAQFLQSFKADGGSADITGVLYDGATEYDAQLFDLNAYSDKISINNSYYLRIKNASGSAISVQRTLVTVTEVESITRGASVASAGSVSWQPAANEHWMIDNLANDTGAYSVDYYDGTNAAGTGADLHSAPGVSRQRSILISNSHYLRYTNSSGSTQKVSISGKRVPSGVTATVAMASLAGGGSTTVQPPSGEQWMLVSTGSQNLNVEFQKYDGVTAIRVAASGATRLSVPLSNSIYLRILNNDGANARYYAYAALKGL